MKTSNSVLSLLLIVTTCSGVAQRKRYQQSISGGTFRLPTPGDGLRRNSDGTVDIMRGNAEEDRCKAVACFAACPVETCAPRKKGQCCDDLKKCTPGGCCDDFCTSNTDCKSGPCPLCNRKSRRCTSREDQFGNGDNSYSEEDPSVWFRPS